jgi:L-ascorbate metabolism protein UlaG (beta-lactamase superfamily)
MQLIWLGHSCVLLNGSLKVLVDPFIGDGIPVLEVPDIVAVTHGHADHFGETLRLAKKTVAINEIAKYLKKQGVPAEGMNIGGTIEVDGVEFTMTPAVHSAWFEPAGPGYCGGAAAGYVITMDGKRIYHAGDTALFSDMKLIGQLYRPDVVFLPIGGRFTMGPDEAMIAAQFVGAPLVIPIHYNTWPTIAIDPSSFRQAIERTTDIRVAVLAPGESIEL